MKVFLQFLIASALVLWLSAVSLGVAGNYFIKDMVELHGSRLADATVQIQDVFIYRKEKKISLYDVCLSGATAPRILCIGSAIVQLPSDFSIEWRRAGFLPGFLTVESFDIKDVSIFYDIDSEGGELRKLKFNLSEKSSVAMKDRLNAKAQEADELLFLQVKALKVSGIKVEAKSRKNPSRSKDFFVDDLVVADLSMQESGIASAEILDQVVGVIVDRVQREARKQGLIEIPAISEGGQSSRKRTSTTAGDRDADSEEEGSASKTVRSIGADLKKTGSDLWQGTKKLFD